MGKRSNFKRSKGDFYITPESAVLPLLPHLPHGSQFDEPCAGNGALVDALEKHGMSCLDMWDIEPKRDDIRKQDNLGFGGIDISNSADFIITNPPWTRALMHPMIELWSGLRPTWLLFDADWMHTKQASLYLEYCHKIVSVGRVSWMGNGVSGKDNAAWYLFDQKAPRNEWQNFPDFIGRVA